MNDDEPVVIVPIETWERLRRMVQHVSLIRDQLTHVAGELDRLVATVEDHQGNDWATEPLAVRHLVPQ